MKKYILILILSLLVFPGRAQHIFAPVGAEWWYYINADMLNNEYKLDHAEATSDTVIMGTPCVKVTTERQIRDRLAPQHLIESADSSLYFKSNGDTVFIFNTIFNRFTPLYVFNAQAGDTICLPIPPSLHPDLRINPYSGDTSFCFIIDSIKMEMYDTAHLKTFYTRTIGDFSQNNTLGAYPAYNWGHIGGRYTERLGGKWGLLPEHEHNLPDFTWVTIGPSGNFRCYSDAQYNIKTVSIPCDSIPYQFLNIKEQSGNDNLKLYPNPSSGMFSIWWQQPLSAEVHIVITDIFCKRIAAATVPAGNTTYSLDLSREPAGMYLLRLSNNNSHVYKKLILQHTAEK